MTAGRLPWVQITAGVRLRRKQAGLARRGQVLICMTPPLSMSQEAKPSQPSQVKRKNAKMEGCTIFAKLVRMLNQIDYILHSNHRHQASSSMKASNVFCGEISLPLWGICCVMLLKQSEGVACTLMLLRGGHHYMFSSYLCIIM